MNEKYVPDLLYWVQERDRIRIKRESKLPPPWTSDPILASNRWCNVHREDDKVTRWVFANFLPTYDQGETTEPFALCVARLVNWPDTLKELGYPEEGWSPEYRQHWLNTFAKLRAEKAKAWTGAYMVTGGFSAGGEPKEVIIARVLDGASQSTLNFLHSAPDTLAEAAQLLACPGMGTFLVAQVIADLKNRSWLRHASDWWTWCAPGPGSSMGLNFLHDRPRAAGWTPETFIEEVNKVRQLLADRLDLHLCAQNTQNCLCEFSKYVRAKHFGERLKNTYTAKPTL